jgi:hypothetical protein
MADNGYWLGIAFFAVIFIAWGLIAQVSSENAVDQAVKKIDQQINFPAPYSGINSSRELALAKIEKGKLLVEEGKKNNAGNSVVGSARASALTNAGLKEINEGMEMLKRVENNTFKNNS